MNRHSRGESDRSGGGARGSRSLVSWGRLLAVFVAFCAVAALDRAPRPVPATAPEGVFSAERAFRHVERIAREPHPAGSAANRRVRDWLLAELGAMGLDPERQPFVHGPLELTNVLARIPGEQPGRAVLLVTHYDSVPYGPGAADAGSCVAALLETARALRASPPVRNDVILLFTDGEELGLLGAAAFVAHHPWAREARVALNFEARGNSGPVMMFETSDPNGWLVQEFAEGVRRPFGTSASVSVYRLLPNDTDFSVLRAAGLRGLNFAMMYGVAHYHTARDVPAELDRRSLQDLGDQALSLARHFGALELESVPIQPDAIYFSVWRRVLVHYPGWLRWPLTLVAFMSCAWVVARGARLGRVRIADVFIGAAAWLVPAGALVFVLRGVWGVASDVHARAAEDGWRTWLIDSVDPAVVVMAALMVAGLHGTATAVLRRVDAASLAVGALVPWAGLTLGATLQLTGFHYAFCVPFLLGAGLLGAGLIEPSSARVARLLGVAQIGVLLLVASVVGPMPRHFFAALVTEPLPALVLVALLYGLAAPYVLAPLEPHPARATAALASSAGSAQGTGRSG